MTSIPYEVTIDWISATFHHAVATRLAQGAESYAQAIAHLVALPQRPEIPAHPKHGYGKASFYGDPPLMTCMWGGSRIDMGVHVQISGTGLRHTKPLEALQALIYAGAKVSRLDLAIDVYRHDASVKSLYEARIQNRVKTFARGYTYITSPGGDTLYLGSRTSEKMLRVYDKGKQLGGDAPWTRIELELKHGKAMPTAAAVASEGIRVIPYIIRTFAECPSLAWYHEATTHEAKQVSIPKHWRESQTQDWLLNVVLPSLEREVKKDPIFAARMLQRLSEIFPDNIIP